MADLHIICWDCPVGIEPIASRTEVMSGISCYIESLTMRFDRNVEIFRHPLLPRSVEPEHERT